MPTYQTEYELVSANYERIKVKCVLAKINKSKSVQGGGGGGNFPHKRRELLERQCARK